MGTLLKGFNLDNSSNGCSIIRLNFVEFHHLYVSRIINLAFLHNNVTNNHVISTYVYDLCALPCSFMRSL